MAKTTENRCPGLRPVAERSALVRRGSTVRVRQRALKIPPNAPFREQASVRVAPGASFWKGIGKFAPPQVRQLARLVLTPQTAYSSGSSEGLARPGKQPGSSVPLAAGRSRPPRLSAGKRKRRHLLRSGRHVREGKGKPARRTAEGLLSREVTSRPAGRSTHKGSRIAREG
jgi:hypothetical protein